MMITDMHSDAEVKNLISRHERASTLIDEEIETLMRKARKLQFQKLQHQEKIKHYQGMITLARRIPPEILATIFEECVYDGWTRTPLTASHVCTEWRKAAAIPTVWSHIYINCDARDPCGRTRFWLDKAQNSPLRVTIEVQKDASHLSRIMDLLLERILQWKDLEINAALLVHANRILAYCNRPSPVLRAVSISVLQEFDGDNDQPEDEAHHGLSSFVVTFPDAPLLHTICLTRNVIPSPGIVPASISNLSISLPCYRVMATLTVAAVVRLLETLPGLQKLQLTTSPRQERQFVAHPDETRRVELNHLHTLILVGSPDIYGVLPHLLTPSLIRLHLRSSTSPLGYPHKPTGFRLRQFIDQADPPLEILELRDIDIPLNDFSACFSKLPGLKELRLHESDISDAVMKQLSTPGGYCPLLTRLDLRWCGQVTGGALVDLVRSRTSSPTGTSPITIITVINCSFVKEQDVVDLARATICQVMMRDSDDYCRKFITVRAPGSTR